MDTIDHMCWAPTPIVPFQRFLTAAIASNTPKVDILKEKHLETRGDAIEYDP
jgi:hypothetical protein